MDRFKKSTQVSHNIKPLSKGKSDQVSKVWCREIASESPIYLSTELDKYRDMKVIVDGNSSQDDKNIPK